MEHGDQTVTMLEEYDYVRCLMIDFSRAFDVIDHPILLAKLSQLDLHDFTINWIVSFLSDRVTILTDNRIRYAIAAWGGFVTAELRGTCCFSENL